MRRNHHNQVWGPLGRNLYEDAYAVECVEEANRSGAAEGPPDLVVMVPPHGAVFFGFALDADSAPLDQRPVGADGGRGIDTNDRRPSQDICIGEYFDGAEFIGLHARQRQIAALFPGGVLQV